MIKSLDDLKRIRKEHENKLSLRQHNEKGGEVTEILIGMTTCGISSGAGDTMNAFIDAMEKQGISNVIIVSVGCIGYCHSEPTVQVNIPGQASVLYGNVKKEKVMEIVEKHIKGGQPVESLVLQIDFERA